MTVNIDVVIRMVDQFSGQIGKVSSKFAAIARHADLIEAMGRSNIALSKKGLFVEKTITGMNSKLLDQAEAFKTVHKSLADVKYEKYLNAERIASASTKIRQQFDMNAMSIMFFGMQVYRTFGGFLQTAVKGFLDLTDYATPLGQSVAQLQGNFMLLQAIVVDALSPSLMWLSELMSDLIMWYAKLSPENQSLIAHLILLAAALGAVGFIYGTTKLGMQGLIRTTLPLNGSITSLIGALGGIVVPAALALIVLGLLNIAATMAGTKDDILAAFGTISENITGVIGDFGLLGKAIAMGDSGAVRELRDNIINRIIVMFVALGVAIVNIMSTAFWWMVGVGGAILLTGFVFLGGAIVKIFDIIGGNICLAWDSMMNDLVQLMMDGLFVVIAGANAVIDAMNAAFGGNQAHISTRKILELKASSQAEYDKRAKEAATTLNAAAKLEELIGEMDKVGTLTVRWSERITGETGPAAVLAGEIEKSFPLEKFTEIFNETSDRLAEKMGINAEHTSANAKATEELTKSINDGISVANAIVAAVAEGKTQREIDAIVNSIVPGLVETVPAPMSMEELASVLSSPESVYIPPGQSVEGGEEFTGYHTSNVTINVNAPVIDDCTIREIARAVSDVNSTNLKESGMAIR